IMGPTSTKELKEKFLEKAYEVGSWGKLVGAITALLTGQDVNVAFQAGSNAIDNNFIPTILLGLYVSDIAFTGYKVYKTFHEEGPEAALKLLGIELVTSAALHLSGQWLFRIGGKVFSSVSEV